MVRFSVDTPLPSGRIRVAVTGRGVIWAAFHEQDTTQLPNGLDLDDVSTDRRATAVTRRFEDYFAGRWREPGFGLPIDWGLTSNLQRRVLQYLEQTVPFGQTITYGELAQRCGGFDSGEFDTDRARSGQAARLVGVNACLHCWLESYKPVA